MTLRERVKSIFEGKIPDVIPWFADLTYWYSAHNKRGDLPDKWRGERGIGKLHRDMRVGEYVPGDTAYEICYDKVEKIDKEKDGILTTYWHTPVGDLTEAQKWLSDSFSWGYIEKAVKTSDDLKIVRYIADHTIYSASYEKVKKLEEELGNDGLPIIALPPSPIAELYKHWCGIIQLSYFSIDAKEEFEKTLQVMLESLESCYKITAEAPCEFIIMCDNLSADTLGGFFSKYMKEFYKEKINLLHSHNKKVFTHLDGKLGGIIEQLPETGLDCIESITPKPVGDMGLEKMREAVGNEIILWGGVPGAMFAHPFGKKGIEEHIMKILRYHRDSGKFVIGVADQVPPDGDISLVGFITELVEEYGRY